MYIHPHDKIIDLKNTIQQMDGIAAHTQNISFNG